MLKKIYDDAVGVLLNPKKYFENLSEPESLKYPLLRALVYMLVFGLLIFIVSAPSLPGISEKLGSFVANIIVMPIMGLIGILVGGIVVMLVSLILGGSSEYKQAVNVASSLLITSLVFSVLMLPKLIPGLLNFSVIVVISIPVTAYLLWQHYLAFVYGMKAKPIRTLILIGIFALLNIAVLILVSLIPSLMRQMLYRGGLNQDDYVVKLDTSVPSGAVVYDDVTSTSTVAVKFGSRPQDLEALRKFFKQK